MQATRVAAVSMNGLLGEPERVLEAIDGWCERAAAAKARSCSLPRTRGPRPLYAEYLGIGRASAGRPEHTAG